MGHRKGSKYFKFDWTQFISDWRLVQSLNRSKACVGMLVFLSRGGWARTTLTRIWTRRCFAASPRIRSEFLAIGRGFQQVLIWWLPKRDHFPFLAYSIFSVCQKLYQRNHGVPPLLISKIKGCFQNAVKPDEVSKHASPIERKGKVKASVARCLRTPPKAAKR